MNREQAVKYLQSSGFSDEQIKAIEGAFSGWGKVCPSAGIDCEDCPAYEDAISRKAVIDTLERMDKALDEDRTVENYKELLRECYKVLPSAKPKSEWEHDHEILKAYSDGANEVLDKIRTEIEQIEINGHIRDVECFRAGINTALNVIDKYKAEGSDKE